MSHELLRPKKSWWFTGAAVCVMALLEKYVFDAPGWFLGLTSLVFVIVGLCWEDIERTSRRLAAFGVFMLFYAAFGVWVIYEPSEPIESTNYQEIETKVLNWITEIDSNRKILNPKKDKTFYFEFRLPAPPPSYPRDAGFEEPPTMQVWFQKRNDTLVIYTQRVDPDFGQCLNELSPQDQTKTLDELREMLIQRDVEPIVTVNDIKNVLNLQVAIQFDLESFPTKSEFSNAAIELKGTYDLISILKRRVC